MSDEQELVQWTLTPKQACLLSEALLAAAMAQHDQFGLLCALMVKQFEKHYSTMGDDEYNCLIEIVQTTARESCECDDCETRRNAK